MYIHVDYKFCSICHYQKIPKYTCVYIIDAQEVVSLAPACKTLLQFMLTMLPECGDNFLPVFRCIHGFCTGDEILSPSDCALLVEQMKLCQSSSEEGGEKEEEDSAAGVENRAGLGWAGITMIHSYVLYIEHFHRV